MRRFDILGHLGAQLRKKFCNNIIRRQTIRVLRREILFANNAVGVDVEESGVGHSFGHSLGFAIEHVEAANDFRIRISQQWEFDFMALGEVLQDSRTIVADRRELQSLRFKPLLCVLQLHELRFAKGSPIGGTEEKENRTLRTFQCLVGLLMAELIGQSKCRRVLADFQAQRWRNGLIGGRIFLPTSKTKQSEKEKYGNRDFHFCSKLEFVFPVQSSTPKTRQSDEISQQPKGYTPLSN
jgi:hypothetical protein